MFNFIIENHLTIAHVLILAMCTIYFAAGRVTNIIGLITLFTITCMGFYSTIGVLASLDIVDIASFPDGLPIDFSLLLLAMLMFDLKIDRASGANIIMYKFFIFVVMFLMFSLGVSHG
ncbi:hypothetical protein HWC21_gp108 [Vibrio phage VAP7]|uniref:Uncharacterized protein n=1 Tax=Vibrio phage VAP7 TaxID=2584487 RepID=A0A4Y5TV93_9CAUD|nr:hypothetical protein HWC21_gp108 [Vibrio phage VAP7]QDB73290.1 hypothetical protein [Vibrio phage VAP7]UFD98025.1 hypothetical protein [Vibrio phage BX-1]